MKPLTYYVGEEIESVVEYEERVQSLTADLETIRKLFAEWESLPPEPTDFNNFIVKSGLGILPMKLREEIVRQLEKARGIDRRACENFMGYCAGAVADFGTNAEVDRELKLLPKEKKDLDRLETALVDVMRTAKLRSRIEHPGVLEYVLDWLREMKARTPPKPRGRPRTREDRAGLVRDCCRYWQFATGQAPTCRASDIVPGFHYAFLRIWNELTGEELTDEALTKDVNDWQNSQ